MKDTKTSAKGVSATEVWTDDKKDAMKARARG